MPGFPAQITRAHLAIKISSDSVHQGYTEYARDTGEQHTKSHLQPFTLGSGRGGGKGCRGKSAQELYEERLGFVTLWRELKGQPLGFLC